MRQNPHPRARTALLALSGVGLGAALVAFCLALTVASPSRNLRPLVPSVDAMYTPLYVSMVAAGLLVVAASLAAASARHGNRALDLSACAGLLTVSVLALAALGLAAAVKTGTEASMETRLTASLLGYGPGNVSIYKAWDDMQSELSCCAVRTNRAQDNYQLTPWYRFMREGNPLSAPKIPNTCCSSQAQGNPSQLSQCTTGLPSLPAQNAFMNPVGCFEAVLAMSDAFTSRYIIVSVLLFLASGAAFGAATFHLVLLTRTLQSSDAKYLQAPSKLPAKFGYANHAAAPSVSLSHASLASVSVASSAGRSGRSSAPSVYSVSSSLRAAAPPTRHPPAPAAHGLSSSSSINNNNNHSHSNKSLHSSSQGSIKHGSPTQSHATSVKAESLPPKPVALAAQPIRSSGRAGRQPSAANRRATAPLANQRATSPPANQRATSPPANQRATLPPANQRATSPPANQRATSPPANQRATSPPANQRATSPPANHSATLPSKNHAETLPKAKLPTTNPATATLTAANQRSAPAPGVAARQPQANNGGQQTMSPGGKRESHF